MGEGGSERLKRDSNQSPQLQRLARVVKVRFSVANFDMILSNMRITMAMTRLRVCSDSSAPMLFGNHKDRFS